MQAFGKVGWQNERTDLDLSYTYADTSLKRRRAAEHARLPARGELHTDLTHNLLNFVNLNGTQFLAEQLLLSGNLYYRHLVTNSINGNVNDNYLSSAYLGPPLDCAVAPASLTQLAYCAPGQNAGGALAQRTSGAALQLTDSQDLLGAHNQAIVGADYSDSRDTFSQSFQYGSLAPDAHLRGQPFQRRDRHRAARRQPYLWSVPDRYAVARLAAARDVVIALQPQHRALAGDSLTTDIGPAFNQANPLTGDYTFSRLNPALGFTLTPTAALTLAPTTTRRAGRP